MAAMQKGVRIGRRNKVFQMQRLQAAALVPECGMRNHRDRGPFTSSHHLHRNLNGGRRSNLLDDLRAEKRARRIDGARPKKLQHFGGEATARDKRLNGLLRRCNASAAEIVDLIQSEGVSKLNTFNQVTALNRLARTGCEANATSEALIAAIEVKIARGEEHFSSRHLSNLAWSAAKIAAATSTTRRMLDTVAAACDPDDFNAHDVANFTWAYATAAVEMPVLVATRLVRLVKGSVRNDFTSQGIANTCWALAKLGIGSTAVFEVLAESAASKLCDFNAQELANLAWAYAKVGARANELLARLALRTIAIIDRLNAQNLTNVVWAYATLDVRDERLLLAVAEASIRSIHRFNPQNVANTLWAYAKLESFHADVFDAVASVMTRSSLRHFTDQNLANMLWAFAKYLTQLTVPLPKDREHRCRRLLNLAAEAALDAIEDDNGFSSQNLCLVIYSFASMVDYLETSRDVSEDQLITKLFERAAFRFASLSTTRANAQDLAHMAWAYATVARRDDELFDAIGARLQVVAANCVPQNIANIAWAFAKCGRKADAATFDTLARCALAKIDDFNEQNLSNLVYAFALANRGEGDVADELFAAVARALEQRRASLCAQDIANAAWAYATVGHKDIALLEALAEGAKFETFNAQNLANMVWAYAKLLGSYADGPAPLFRCCDQFFFRLLAELRLRLDGLKAQELANSAWALGRIFRRGAEKNATACKNLRTVVLFFISLERVALTRLDNFNSQDVCTTLWGFAALGVDALDLFAAFDPSTMLHDQDSDASYSDFRVPLRLVTLSWAFAKSDFASPRVFEAIARSARVDRLSPSELSNLAWAFAAQGHTDDALLADIANRAFDLGSKFKPQDRATLLWAFASIGPVGHLGRLWRQTLEAYQVDSFDTIAKSQLQQARLALLPAADSAPAEWSAPLRDALAKSAISEHRSGSLSQLQLSADLKRLGWNHVYEYVDESGLSLDMADPAAKQAVEFDGPVHFFANRTDQPTGRTNLKRKLLANVGWNTIFVSTRTIATDDPQQRLSSLRSLLIQHSFVPQIQGVLPPQCIPTTGPDVPEGDGDKSFGPYCLRDPSFFAPALCIDRCSAQPLLPT